MRAGWKRLKRVRRALAVALAPITLAAAIPLAGGVVACGRPPVLTDSLVERYNLVESDLRRVQLYTSDEIVLRREVTAQERSLSGAELRVHGGIREEEVVIPARTPCVVLRVEGPYLLIGFAATRPDLSLWFKLDTKSEPSAEGRRYMLAPIANAPNEKAPLVVAKGFLVHYGGKKYRPATARSWSAHLLVDLDESFAKDRIRLETPGWKLSEQPVAPSLSISLPSPSPADAGDLVMPTSDAGTPAPDAGAHP